MCVCGGGGGGGGGVHTLCIDEVTVLRSIDLYPL